MTVVQPDGVPSLGATKITATLAVATLTAPSLASEVGAATAVEISGYLFADGWNPGGSQGKGQARRRLAATTTKETLNPAQWTSPTLQYAHDPNAGDADPGNEARELLKEGVEVFIIERNGQDADEAFAVGDQVTVHHLRMGRPFPQRPTDENGEFFIMQETEYVNDGPVEGAIAA